MIKTIEKNEKLIAVIDSGELLITGTQSALDLMTSVDYGTGSNRIAINKSAITEDFFKLSTGIAGEILQKFVNYRFKLAIYGDFSRYTSKPLKDFIYESNNGKDIFFLPSLDQAVERLSKI